MASTNDGGPVLPEVHKVRKENGRTRLERIPGMRLRDYFAAQAMAAMTSRESPPAGGDGSWAHIAAHAYAAADAMLAARGAA